MTKVLMMPVLAAVLFAGGCGDDPVEVDPRPSVRFFSAVWNTPDNVGFIANNQFAAGSALGYLQSSQTCARLNPGNTSFGVGLANATGTALNGNELGSLINQNIAAHGNYTVLTGGNVLYPSVVLLDNSLSGTLGPNQAAVRFVNLAAAAQYPFDVLSGTAETGPTTVVKTGMAYKDATPFSIVTSGSNAYTIMANNQPVISGSAATLDLQAGSINTVVIGRSNPPSGQFNLVNVPSCP